MNKNKMRKQSLVLIALVGILVFLYVFFFRGFAIAPPTYQEAACTWEGSPENCLEQNADWKHGISYFRDQLKLPQTTYLDTLEALRSLLWTKEGWALNFAGEGAPSVHPEAVFPLRILKRDSSGCLGLAWLAMMVAESEHFGLEVILLPSHVVLRYHGVYMEPNLNGYSYTENEYKQKYAKGPWTGLEWKPLTRKQILGLVAFNLGNEALRQHPRMALKWYDIAKSYFPEYPGISINREIAQDALN